MIGSIDLKSLIQNHGSQLAYWDVSSNVRVEYKDLPDLISVRASQIQSFLNATNRSSQSHPGFKKPLVFMECQNQLDEVLILLAMMFLNCIVVPISFRFTEIQLQKLVADLMPQLMILHRPGRFACPTLSHSTIRTLEAQDAGSLSWHLDLNQPITGIFTSGTTGQPKLALHTLNNHYASALACQQCQPLQPGHQTLFSLPLFHIGGMAQMFRNLIAGSTLVLGGRGDDARFLREFSITHVSLVETQLKRLLNQDKQPFDIPYALVGGGPVDKLLLKQAQTRGLHCWQTYGMTETTSQMVTCNPSGVCQVLPGNELKLNSDGEVLVRGPVLFAGYWMAGKLTNPHLDDQGWHHTKDLGQWQEQQVFKIIGRLDHQFVSGGENIQPEEIESALLSLEQVIKAVVLPISDPEFGSVPIAIVDTSLSFENLTEKLRTQLPGFKVPKGWLKFPKPEQNFMSGIKINRQALQLWVKDHVEEISQS